MYPKEKRNGHVNGTIKNGDLLTLNYDFHGEQGHRSTKQHPLSRNDAYLPIPSLSSATAAIFVFSLAVTCFAVSYDGDFVFDDTSAVLKNSDVLPDTPLSQMFLNDFWGKPLDDQTSHKSYRPLTVLTFRWSYYFAGGFVSTWFHVPNILLHGVVSVLLLPVLSILFRAHGIYTSVAYDIYNFTKSAFLCAVLFAVHPIHTESVSSVVGRADLLCAVCFLLSFYSYSKACLSKVRDDQNNLYPAGAFSMRLILVSMVMCCLAVLCKEQGITVLGICSVYDIVIISRVDMGKLFKRKTRNIHCSHGDTQKKILHTDWLMPVLKRHMILCATGVVILMMRWKLMGSTLPRFEYKDNPHASIKNSVLRTLNINYLYTLNSWLLINPWWLCFDWSMGCVPVLESLTDPRVIPVVVLWTAILALIYVCLRGEITQEQRILTMSLALIIVPFLPASNLFFRVGFVIAERILYLSSIGTCLLVITGFRKLCKAFPQHLRVLKCCMVLLIAVFMARSITRSGQWRTEMSLFSSGVSVCSLNAKIHYNLGKIQADKGHTDYAIQKYRLAILLSPDYDNPHNNLGVLLEKRHEYEEAERLLTRAVQISPDYKSAWNNLGIVKAATLKYAEAETCYKQALQLPGSPTEALYNLGNLYKDMKLYDAALEAWKNVTRLDFRVVPAWVNSGLLLNNLGRINESIARLQQGLEHHPNEGHLHSIIASAYGDQGRHLESEHHYKRAITLLPQESRHYANLGILYHKMGRYEEARRAYRQTLALNPNHQTAKKNLAILEKG